MVCSATFVSSHIHKNAYSLRFIAVLDDCNDSQEAGNDQMQEEGEGERKRRVNGARERGRKGKDSRKAREGKEEERKKEREKGREGAREKGRVRIGKKASEGERALLASVVHVARALYMNVTQDVAIGLSCIMHDYARLYRIPCTPTTDYPEYHAPLRLILLYPVYDSDRFARFFMKIANKFA